MDLLHKTIKAAATATDKGEFTAIIAAYSVDRVGDEIMPGAFKGTIERWQSSGKMIPLHWDHSAEPQNIIGYVDPQTMREGAEGLYVRGKLDLEGSAVAREAWRAMKDNSVAFSFGYLIEQASERDGVQQLKALDLFEISVTPAPVNPDTRILSLKSNVGARAHSETATQDEPGITVSSPWLVLNESEAVFPESELKGVVEWSLKAVWTTAYVNALPDSAFLYIEPGGEKDSEGKTTPRSLRHFPYKDASGAVDLPHLRNALARIPQSNLPQDVKDRLTAKAQAILANATKAIEDARAEDPPKTGKAEAQDPLEKSYDDLMFRLTTRGIDVGQPPRKSVGEEPQGPSLDELEQHHDDLMFKLLTGSEVSDP